MTKTIELIYSQQASDFIQGRAYSNPRFFSSPRSGVSKVYIVGDWPNIVAAYEALGVPVERLDAEAATGAPPAPAAEPPPVPSMTAEERAATEIPADWDGLSWPQLRKLGAVFSDTPVLNKTDAAAAITAELARRGDVGLTVTEICADLEAMGLEFDPTESRDELLAQRNAGRRARG